MTVSFNLMKDHMGEGYHFLVCILSQMVYFQGQKCFGPQFGMCLKVSCPTYRLFFIGIIHQIISHEPHDS